MIPEVSLILSISCPENLEELIGKTVESLGRAPPFKDMEVVIVICSPETVKDDDFNLPKNLPFSVRVFQTQSLVCQEGETLGAWLAYGQILVFGSMNHLEHLGSCEVSHALSSKVVLGWGLEGVEGVSWATSKRTFWQDLIGVKDAWPEGISYVGFWFGGSSSRESSPCSSVEKDDEIKEPALIDDAMVDDRSDEINTETQEAPVKNIKSEPSPLPRSPLPIKESFLGSPYRQWKWKHLKSVGKAKSRPYVVYCAVFGYPNPFCHSISSMADAVSDAIFFTDVKWPRHHHGWTVIYMPNIFVFQTTCRDPAQTMSRIPKLLPNVFLSTYVANLYIDNNIILRRPVSIILKTWLGRKEWGALSHRNRRCAYQEMDACIRCKKDNPKFIEAQRKAYLKARLPRMAGLAENPVLARVNSKSVAATCHLWWAETQRFSKRDQISFAYVAWKHKYWSKVNLVHKTALGHNATSRGGLVYKGGKMGSVSSKGGVKGNTKGTKGTAKGTKGSTKGKPKTKSTNLTSQSKKLRKLLALVQAHR